MKVHEIDSLLYTKIHIPALLEGLMHRKALLALIDSGLGKYLTLVPAPAGYGKITLLCDWIVNQSSETGFIRTSSCVDWFRCLDVNTFLHNTLVIQATGLQWVN